MTILGGSNVSGERIPGGSGNKEERGTRVGVRPGRRDKLERAPRAGGETIAQLHKGSPSTPRIASIPPNVGADHFNVTLIATATGQSTQLI